MSTEPNRSDELLSDFEMELWRAAEQDEERQQTRQLLNFSRAQLVERINHRKEIGKSYEFYTKLIQLIDLCETELRKVQTLESHIDESDSILNECLERLSLRVAADEDTKTKTERVLSFVKRIAETNEEIPFLTKTIDEQNIELIQLRDMKSRFESRMQHLLDDLSKERYKANKVDLERAQLNENVGRLREKVSTLSEQNSLLREKLTGEQRRSHYWSDEAALLKSQLGAALTGKKLPGRTKNKRSNLHAIKAESRRNMKKVRTEILKAKEGEEERYDE